MSIGGDVKLCNSEPLLLLLLLSLLLLMNESV